MTPREWAEAPLGEVTQVVSGSTPRTGELSFWGGDIPWLTPDDLSRHREKRVTGGKRALTQAGYESCSTQLVPAGTVLYTSRAPIGYVAIAARSICTNQGFKSFVPADGLDSDYLYWFLRHSTPEIRKLGSGTTFPELSKKSAQSIVLPLPPLAEQRRIVAAIEEQFSRLDASENAIGIARRRLDVLETSVLAAAFGAPSGSLRDFLREPLRNGHSAKASSDGTGVRTLTLTAVTRREFIDSHTKLADVARHRVEDLWLRSGDVFVQRSNTPELVGSSALYRGHEGWAIFPDLLIRVRTTDQLIPEYLALYLRAPQARDHLRRRAQGLAGSMPKIDQRAVGELPIPIVSLDEQRRIVAEIEQQLSLIDSLRAAVESAQKRSAAVRRSILERAFRGELVPQDPDDEPASVLLERIRAERAAAPKPSRRRATMKAP